MREACGTPSPSLPDGACGRIQEPSSQHGGGEWTQEPWSNDWGGSFQYVDEDQLVMTEYEMPDGHFVYFENKEQYEDYLEEWLTENPGWHKHRIMNIWVKNDDIEDKEK